jgi:SUKH-4 immunity protein
MISPEIYSKLATYWQNQNVTCRRAAIDGKLFGTELAKIWELIGMPEQDWWLFRFFVPSDAGNQTDVRFGTIGTDWELVYRVNENTCFARSAEGNERFANSSFASFTQMLVLFDKGHRTIQRECSGDSGGDWDHGDIIIKEMERSMRLVDAAAFNDASNLWPYLLVDANG